MKINLEEIPIRDIGKGYLNKDEEGVVGYNGKLNIRPKYQREWIYSDPQKNAVIDTIMHNLPLNAMYWAKNKDGTYEVLDGQQRTISFCEYFYGNFCVGHKYFHNLDDKEKEKFLDYKLMVYVCEGNDKDKLDWFRTINTGCVKLTDQELRNAIYTGTWLTNAKRYFSKTKCPAYGLANNYMNGTPIRQEYLETVLEWAANKDDVDSIETYMAKKQHNKDAVELWEYFKNVIDWVKKVFTTYRKEMKGLDWGVWYNLYGNDDFNPTEMEEEVKRLMTDDDVTSRKGIYEYLLTKNERKLSIREFSETIKRQVFESQNGVCIKCDKKFDDYDEMEADHITPWSEGGTTTKDNCQLLCKKCNRTKSNK